MTTYLHKAKDKPDKPLPHLIPSDLKKSLRSDSKVLNDWFDITDLARNEFICWIISAKKPSTRQRRISRTIQMLNSGKRRPCCWYGCRHRY